MTTAGDEEPASVLRELYAASEAEVVALIDSDSGRDAEPAVVPGRDAPPTRSESSNTSRAARAALVANLRRRGAGSLRRTGEQTT